MIARCFVGADPFVVWGNGTQIRNWTHVSDILCGTILAAERIDDGTAENLGTMERTTELRPEMPTGPSNRVANNALARQLLGWRPQVTFAEGVRRTADWYFATRDTEAVRASPPGSRIAERV